MLLAEIHAVTKMFAVHHTCIPNEHKFDSVLPDLPTRWIFWLYGCEVWQLLKEDATSANVALNNAFRLIFNACWRKV